MKKDLTLVLAIGLSLAVPGMAQITLTGSQLPAPGLSFKAGMAANPGTLKPGAAGAGKTWDFSGLAAASDFSIRYLSPAGTPLDTVLKSANLASISTKDSAYTYYRYQNSGLAFLGTYMRTNTVLGAMLFIPEEPMTLLKLPLKFGDSLKDTSFFPIRIYLPPDTLEATRSETTLLREDKADAWGTLKLPWGDFQALRIKSIHTSRESAFVRSAVTNGKWTLQSASSGVDSTFSWYTSQSLQPYLTLTITDSGTVSGTFVQAAPNAGLGPRRTRGIGRDRTSAWRTEGLYPAGEEYRDIRGRALPIDYRLPGGRLPVW
ncbi:MAG TPA: hypothetical protein VJ385_03910 [Fibrobacteria bacterium]|nr:hypothetical protein [Fibrobacteria bacterium]